MTISEKTKNILSYVLPLPLLTGTIVAWYSVLSEFAHFYGVEKSLFKFTNCVARNPLTTPCFYGAIAFLICLGWSLYNIRLTAEIKNKQYGYLQNLLIGATIFAWCNFGYEVFKFIKRGSAPIIGCSGQIVSNPLATACFAGSAFFLTSLIIVSVMVKSTPTNLTTASV